MTMDPTRLLQLDGVLTHVTTGDDRDEFNNPVEATSTSNVKCWVEQLDADDDTVDTDQQTDLWRVVLAPGAPATGWDRLEVGDMEFSFKGPPWPATNPRTLVITHIEGKGVRIQ